MRNNKFCQGYREKRTLLGIPGGNLNAAAPMKNNMEIPQKIKMEYSHCVKSYWGFSENSKEYYHMIQQSQLWEYTQTRL